MPPNKRMQRARDPDKFVLNSGHRRVADARRYAARLSGPPAGRPLTHFEAAHW
jgi:hypothetical protein